MNDKSCQGLPGTTHGLLIVYLSLEALSRPFLIVNNSKRKTYRLSVTFQFRPLLLEFQPKGVPTFVTPGWAWSELVPSLPFWQANKNKLLEVIKIHADGVPPHIHTLTLTDTYPPSQAHMVISVTYRGPSSSRWWCWRKVATSIFGPRTGPANS